MKNKQRYFPWYPGMAARLLNAGLTYKYDLEVFLDFLTYASLSDPKAEIFPSIPTLSSHGHTPHQVRETLKRAVEAGLIALVKEGGGRATNAYVATPKLNEVVTGAPNGKRSA